jgi:UDP-N-acetylmuramoyl-L-alanyl-D-glutamate--2,6-diaminopimelate ligase
VVERLPSEQTFLLSVGSHSTPVRTALIGDPHIANCLAAAAAGVALGIDLPTIIRGLESVQRLPGRMERVECGQPFSVFVDAASGPETLAQTIKSVRQVTTGRVRVVFGAGAEKSSARKALLGRVLERGAHQVVLTSADPLAKNPLATVHDYLDGFERPHRASIVPTRRKAIQAALAEARPGDAILIAGRNHLGAVGECAGESDREIAADFLYGQPGPCEHPRFRVVG